MLYPKILVRLLSSSMTITANRVANVDRNRKRFFSRFFTKVNVSLPQSSYDVEIMTTSGARENCRVYGTSTSPTRIDGMEIRCMKFDIASIIAYNFVSVRAYL